MVISIAIADIQKIETILNNNDEYYFSDNGVVPVDFGSNVKGSENRAIDHWDFVNHCLSKIDKSILSPVFGKDIITATDERKYDKSVIDKLVITK